MPMDFCGLIAWFMPFQRIKRTIPTHKSAKLTQFTTARTLENEAVARLPRAHSPRCNSERRKFQLALPSPPDTLNISKIDH